jgi:hypothetical protein
MLKSWEELTELEQAQCIYSDMHKDAYGFRPRFDYSQWTLDQFQTEFTLMSEVIDQANEDRRASEREAEHDFEMRVLNLLSSGAQDRTMAMRWIHEAENTNGDDEYLAWTLGLKYRYFTKETV